jgi:hypothetical protein
MRKIILKDENFDFDIKPEGKKFKNNSKPSSSFSDSDLFELAYKSLGKRVKS